uniref:NADH-ubiquinone oxidoreductase chain 5 n=1 Tax=Phaenacantha marcida TaxID=498930 RepID=B7SMJ9_9HEMI|nr:NADH dehydrogenase subunit 5 [Phaenacantha marcida]ABZ02093.1 NADH dehydrogenase subunit 5 [Phaenacantha marcida]
MNLYILFSSLLFVLGLIFYFLGLFFVYFDYLVLIDWDIITFNSCSVVMTLLFDYMSFLFIGSVMFISSMVIFYSYSYMSMDFNSIRFLFLVILFIFSMLLMIISPNLLSILLGWDGLGLVSYCLVIYFQNYKSYNSGMLTVLTNRIGDVFILLSASLLFSFGSWYFIYYNFYLSSWMFYFSFLVVLSSFTSSAQIPFSSWLPAAMAAPTPVSALVHSSTLVTAGVYLMIRFSSLFINLDITLFLLISVLTMFMSGVSANFEFDLSKIIALSTLSQLGLMMSIIFMGDSCCSFFHLLTHAFFKALLFLCAGLIIHCVGGSQDIRFMGSLVNILPYTSSCFCISNLSLCGLPFFSGFYSSDMVVELMNMNYFNLFIYFVFYLSIGLTVCYSFRLCYYIMFNVKSSLTYCFYFEDMYMMLSMIFLSLMGIVMGSFLSWVLFSFPDLIILPFECKMLVFIFGLLGLFLGLSVSYLSYYSLDFTFVDYFLTNMWFLPDFSTLFVANSLLPLSLKFYDSIDLGWGEYLVSCSLSYYIIFLSKLNIFLQNNGFSVIFIIFLFMTFMLII